MLYVDKFNKCFEVQLKDIAKDFSSFDEIALKSFTNKNGILYDKIEPRNFIKIERIKVNLMEFFIRLNNGEFKDFNDKEIEGIVETKFKISWINDVPEYLKDGSFFEQFKNLNQKSLLEAVWNKLLIEFSSLANISKGVERSIKKTLFLALNNKNKYNNGSFDTITMREFLRLFCASYNQVNKELDGVKIKKKEDLSILARFHLMDRFADEIEV